MFLMLLKLIFLLSAKVSVPCRAGSSGYKAQRAGGGGKEEDDRRREKEKEDVSGNWEENAGCVTYFGLKNFTCCARL